MALPNPHGATNDLDQFVHDLQREFGFHLISSTGDWAPAAAAGSDESRFKSRIRYLWNKDQDGLRHCVYEFRRLEKPQKSLNDFEILFNHQYKISVKRQQSSRSFTNGSRSFLAANTSANTSFTSTTTGSSSIFSRRPDSARTSFTETSIDPTPPPQPTPEDLPPSPPPIPLRHASLAPSVLPQVVNGTGVPPGPTSVFDVSRDQDPDDPTPTILEHFQLRDLPTRELFVNDLPGHFNSLPWYVRYECTRLVAHFNIPTYALGGPPNDEFLQYHSFYEEMQGKAPVGAPKAMRASQEVWKLAEQNSDTVILSGTLKVTGPKSPSPFSLRLSVLNADPKSYRFARKFGASRFLKIFVPSFRNLPRYLSPDRMKQRFQEWLASPEKKLMGSSWSVFHAKPNQKTAKQSRRFRDPGEAGGHEIILFATSGPELTPMSLEQLFDWFMPMELNRHQPFSKAYTRLELGFSRTFETIVFEPDQVEDIGDTLADGAPEDESLKDQTMNWQNAFDPSCRRVMNDGCSLMSVRAAERVWESLSKNGFCGNESMPSAFQARFGPAKGVWMVAHRKHDKSDEETWIKVTTSQLKFTRHSQDRDAALFDPARSTFEVNSWAAAPSLSRLYLDYLPILENRGVSRQSLREFVSNTIRVQREPLEDALKHPLKLRRWLQDKCICLADTSGFESSRWKRSADKAKILLDSGFNPAGFRYLAESVIKTISYHLAEAANTMKVELPYSTYLLGVADPVGCLDPDEIYVMFSDPTITGTGIQWLDDVDVLVSRHPALRPCDIQRARVVFKRELMHIKDVAVFSSRGSYPFASKLQGGDYDGDRFWMCWDSNVVQSFRNAPPPIVSPIPGNYGIDVKGTSSGEIWQQSGFAAFLMRNFDFQWQDQFLGIVTNYHEQLTYATKSLHGQAVEAVANVHDLLVDSAKNGYCFDAQAWTELQKSLHIPRQLPKPKFRRTERMDLFDASLASGRSDHIVDHLVFDVAREEARHIVEHFRAELTKTPDKRAECLVEPLDSFQQEYCLDDELVEVFNNLCGSGIREIYLHWRKAADQSEADQVRGHDSHTAWDQGRAKCRQAFVELQPKCRLPHSSEHGSCQHPMVRAWVKKTTINAPSTWDLMKASALYKGFYSKPNFVFQTAGDELCFLKAFSVGRAVPCVPEIFSALSVRKRKLDALEEPNETEAIAQADVAGEDTVMEPEGSFKATSLRHNSTMRPRAWKRLARGSSTALCASPMKSLPEVATQIKGRKTMRKTATKRISLEPSSVPTILRWIGYPG